MTEIPTTALSTGDGSIAIPTLGFGVWQVPEDAVEGAVGTALAAGYRSIDTARIYGNEAGVGRAIADFPREDLFITTKVWNDDQGAAATAGAFERSLDRLGLEVLDLYLIHWPSPQRELYVETWATLLELRASGRVRAVGVCNFNADHLQRLRDETGEYPAINQIELHPYLQQTELRAFHARNGIVTEAWSPLASGKAVLDDIVIAQIAQKHRCTPAQAIIAWHLAIGNVVIPKSVTPSRIAENIDVFGITLDADDLLAMDTLERGMRTGPDPAMFEG